MALQAAEIVPKKRVSPGRIIATLMPFYFVAR
jgi:hypothetical protein